MAEIFTKTFKTKTRAEWEAIFLGTDACCLPVISHHELDPNGLDRRLPVTLKDSPVILPASRERDGRADSMNLTDYMLAPGVGGEDVVSQWTGWKRGNQYDVKQGGLVRVQRHAKL